MLLNVFAILLPCGGRIAAPGLINSNVKGEIAVALGVTVIVPLAGVVQLPVIAVVKVGAVAALTVTALVAVVAHTSVSKTV